VKRFYLLVEGQTEEAFVRELLGPHYARLEVFITPIILSTRPGHRGGVTSYAKVQRQIVRLCKQDPDAAVSTMLDLYALPDDFPGKAHDAYPAQGSGRQKAEFIESQWTEDIDQPNFLAHLTVHEFEALLFAEPRRFSEWTDSPHLVDQLLAVTQAHATPEDINESRHTAPSKRLLHLMPGYKKTLHGPLIAAEIGLDVLRSTCLHFDAWLSRLEQLAQRG
jgi:hypothetical protein